MSAGLQSFKFFPGFFGIAGVGYSQNSRREPRWELRVTFSQVILLWLIMAAVMLFTFLFGFHKGRSQGLAVALEEYGEQSVRLPIIQPVMEGSGLKSRSSEFSATKLGLNQSESVRPATSVAIAATTMPSKAETMAREPAYDFSSNKTVAAEFAPRKTETVIPDKAAASAGLKKVEQSKIEPEKKEIAKTSKLVSGWYVQTAAAMGAAEAGAHLGKLQKGGFPVVLEEARVNDKKYLRILAGPYSDKRSALDAKEKIEKSRVMGSVSSFIKFVE